jgi:1-acyl-sn-glycerol-3-phosphate acyltransferase
MRPVVKTYGFFFVVLRPFLKWAFRVRYVGRERVPLDRPVIFSGNHESYADPIMLGEGFWKSIHFMARSDLFEKNAAFRWLLYSVGAFPVVRGTPDRNAITTASKLLECGEWVGIFPEGTRHHEGQGEGQGGAALIALRTDAVVVPVGIAGTDLIRPEGVRFLHLPKVVIVMGEPLDTRDFAEGSRRERVEAITVELMARIESARLEGVSIREGGRA